MVTPNARRNRGQVILIGAITLAFILLGIVVVFNGVLYTETLSSSAASQSTADAEVVEQGLERNLVEIAHRGNLNGNWDSGDSFKEVITDPSGFADQYQNTTANSRSAIVDLQDVNTEEPASVRSGGLDSEPTVDLNDNRVGYFTLTLSDPDNTGKVTINVTKEDNTSTEITLEEESSTYDITGASCDPSAHARVNLVTGEVNGSDCGGLDLITSSGYDQIEITADESGFDGSYDLVARDMDSGYDGIWKIEADITYESNQVSYERTDATIEVYGDKR